MADEEYKKTDTCSGQDSSPKADEEMEPQTDDLKEESTAGAEESGCDCCGDGAKEDSCGACDGTQEAEATDDDPEQAQKKGFFSRNKKADKEKTELKEKVDALEDRVRRQMAEFDNYRKRTEKEKDQMFSMGEKNVIEKILPIVDNFERGLDTVEEADKGDAFVTGMEKIYTQLVKQLEAFGVTPIEAVGKEFNPELHNAVMQVETTEYESGTVAQELQKGYMYRDQVLRHSMVGVAQ